MTKFLVKFLGLFKIIKISYETVEKYFFKRVAFLICEDLKVDTWRLCHSKVDWSIINKYQSNGQGTQGTENVKKMEKNHTWIAADCGKENWGGKHVTEEGVHGPKIYII